MHIELSESQIILINLTAILVLGIGAHWLCSRLRLPSILLLLTFGFLAGPIPRLLQRWLQLDNVIALDPDVLFGAVLMPMVALAVALILFEGGLNLHFRELTDIAVPLRRLLTIGVAVTFALTTLAALLLLQWSFFTSMLIGAILVVTGPTVIGPLLQHIRPVGKSAAIARWEGIIIDPIGAIMAVLVFEIGLVVAHAQPSEIVVDILWAIGKTIVLGGVLGVLGRVSLVYLLRRYWIPDSLHNPVVLTMVALIFTISNCFAHESGLLAVTLMGILLANQKHVTVHHIIEFKENITVMLIAGLFILLAARIQPDQLEQLNWPMLAFVLVLMLIIRPASVFLSTIGQKLNLQERLFLSWLAPRGIVAAAVASVFALKMQKLGNDLITAGEAAQGQLMITEGKGLVAAVFMVIVVTVAVYGLTAPIVARRLNLASANPQGLLIASAHAGARAIALALKEAGFKVVLTDLNRFNMQAARLEGLQCYYGSILSNEVVEDMDLGGIGRFLAFTSNDQVNSLAAWHLSEIFNRENTYQLVPEPKGAGPTEMALRHLHGRLLFAPDATYKQLDERFAAGAVVKKTKLSKDFDFAAFQEHYGNDALVLFIIQSTGKLQVVTADSPPKPQPEQTIIALVKNATNSNDPQPPPEA